MCCSLYKLTCGFQGTIPNLSIGVTALDLTTHQQSCENIEVQTPKAIRTSSNDEGYVGELSVVADLTTEAQTGNVIGRPFHTVTVQSVA